jgi:hypothetical protein
LYTNTTLFPETADLAGVVNSNQPAETVRPFVLFEEYIRLSGQIVERVWVIAALGHLG